MGSDSVFPSATTSFSDVVSPVDVSRCNSIPLITFWFSANRDIRGLRGGRLAEQFSEESFLRLPLMKLIERCPEPYQ